MKLPSLIIFLFLNCHLFSQYIDLEKDLKDDFVLETKKINIPGFPFAFNPSLVRWKGQFLMSFRVGKNENHSENPFEGECLKASQDIPSFSPNQIGLIFLDKNFKIMGPPQILNLINYNQTCRQQDPRIIVVGEHLYICYCDPIQIVGAPDRRLMFLSEVHDEDGHFYIKDVECLDEFEWNNGKRWEKNWSPFDYQGNLLLIYSINPHRVMRPYLGTGVCETISSTYANPQWEWGELRGGTPALLVDGQYLAFFHSSIPMTSVQSEGKKMAHYFMGAYTFSPHPPFTVTAISPKPIVGKDFYNGPAYNTWKPLRVVFPCGYVIENKMIWVAYGRQDHEIWIAKMHKDKLLKSLIPTHSLQ